MHVALVVPVAVLAALLVYEEKECRVWRRKTVQMDSSHVALVVPTSKWRAPSKLLHASLA